MAGFNKGTGLCTPDISLDLRSRPHLEFSKLSPSYLSWIHSNGRRGKTGHKPSNEAMEHWAKSRALAFETTEKRTCQCKGCGVEFTISSPYGYKAFCTVKCREDYRKRTTPLSTLICGQCGTPFQTKSSHQKTRSRAGIPVFHNITCRNIANSLKKRAIAKAQP